MRFPITVLYCVALCVMVIGDTRIRSSEISRRLQSEVQRYVFEREVRLSGLAKLSEQDILSLLPNARSNLWWHFNVPQIEARLRGNPFVLEAHVGACTAMSFDCFTVEIAERIPSFVALVNDEGVILGQDGGVLHALPVESATFTALAQRLPMVSGLRTPDVSPDVLRARFEKVRSAVSILESEVQQTVRAVTFSGEDMVVRFQNIPYRVIFPATSRNAADDAAWKLQIRSSAHKLVRLRGELASRYGPDAPKVEKIDLGADSHAVVSFSEDAALAAKSRNY